MGLTKLFDADPEFTELSYRWVLWQTKGVGYRTFLKILEYLDGHLQQLRDPPDQLLDRLDEIESVGAALESRLLERLVEADPQERYKQELESLPPDARLVHMGSQFYPQRLWDLEKPPIFLYIRGDLSILSHPRTVSIVGSRSVGRRGVRFTENIARDLGESGVAVVSGGAIGVDAAAHRGCVEAETPTVVVFPGGIDKPRPSSNRRLFQNVLEHGVWISEYPIGTDVRRFHFHRRNRIIAALGDGVVIARAGKKSGTMITARAARDIERPLLVVPGRVDDPLAQGSLDLLVSGAQCVRGSSDILEKLFGTVTEGDAKVNLSENGGADGEHSSLDTEALDSVGEASRRLLKDCCEWLERSDGDSFHIDELVDYSEMTASEINSALLELELHNLVDKKTTSNRYTLQTNRGV